MFYFNFLYAPSGGGYQNSLSFVRSLIDSNFDFSDIKFFIYKDTELHNICIDYNIKYFTVRKGVVRKLMFELFSRKFVRRGNVVFSIFGPPMLTTTGYTLNVGGMAISNVFYNGVDFWGYMNPLSKALKKVKDTYRKYRYSKLDYWIFETDLLLEKAVTEFGFPRDRCSVVRMAPSALVSPYNVKKISRLKVLKNAKNCFLFLCSAHPNKRLHILPDLSKLLVEFGLQDFKIVFTARENEYLSDILDQAEIKNVSNLFINLGPVKPDEVATVIDCCDYICNFSVLESFSNNFVEAWAMNKPLIVTNDLWAKESCKDSAYYIDVDTLDLAAEQLLELVGSSKTKDSLITNGNRILAEYPTAMEKTYQYIDVIRHAVKMGRISSDEKSSIRL